jgi:NAD(P)-dependent dehydrogenase (short-subunit alcohol dehydrogenase family)
MFSADWLWWDSSQFASIFLTLTDTVQIKSALPELKKSKGSVVWVSSGAATGAYTAWGAYGSGKAAANHIIAHLGVEEPDITSIAVAPGRVDTDMQKLIRDSGKDSMAEKDHASFIAAHADGQLVQPEQPGTVIANFVAQPETSLSGKFLKYVCPAWDTGVSSH